MLFGKSGQPRIAALSIVLLALTACTTTAPRGDWSPSVASRVKIVAISDIAEPAVDLALNLGQSNENHASTYAQALASKQIVFSPLLAEAITRQLERNNYQVIPLAAQRPVVASDGSIDLPDMQADADAILVARFIKAGYGSASTSDLLPWVIVEVKLFDSRSRRLLYSRTFNAGYDARVSGAVHLATQARFRFASPQQLTEQIELSAGGIKDAELAIAGAVGLDFSIGSRPAVNEEAPPEEVTPPMSADERDRQTAAALAAQWAEVPRQAQASTLDAGQAAIDEVTDAAAAESGGEEQIPESETTAVTPQLTEVPVPSSDPETETMQTIPTIEAVEQPATAAEAPVAPAANEAEAAVVENDVAADIVVAAPAAATTSESPDISHDGTTITVKDRTPVRVSPTTQAEVIAVLPAGANAKRDARVIHNADGSWCYITAATAAGWVPLDALGR